MLIRLSVCVLVVVVDTPLFRPFNLHNKVTPHACTKRRIIYYSPEAPHVISLWTIIHQRRHGLFHCVIYQRRQGIFHCGLYMGNSVQCIKITADILRPIVGKTSHHIKKYGRNKMASVMIKQDDMFVSHDAMSLITNTLINATLCVTKKRLEKYTDLKLRTNINVDVRSEGGTVKLLVYRHTLTMQYQNINPHQPLHQKVDVIKILQDRCSNTVSEPEDRQKDVKHTTNTLQRCSYPIHKEDERTEKVRREIPRKGKIRTQKTQNVLSLSGM